MTIHDIIIIGGGLAGVTTFYELTRRGKDVVLLEAQDELACGTSYANGGMVTPSMPDPWNSPGVGKHLMSSLFDPFSPMKLRVKAIPGLTAWGLRFLRNSTPARYKHAVENNYRLAAHSAEKTWELRDLVSGDVTLESTGSLKVFDNEAAFKGQVENAENLKDYGMTYRVVSPDEIIELEPQLENAKDKFLKGIHYTQDLVGDAHLFTKSLANQAVILGGKMKTGVTVSSIERTTKGFKIRTQKGTIQARNVVIAAGCQSPKISATMGVKLPIKPAKGYSLTLSMEGWNARPGMPVIDDAMHAAVAPLGNKIRLAGTAEFTGFDDRIDQTRIENLFNLFQRLYPDLYEKADRSTAESWTGFRPMSADGMPYIGQTKIPGLWINSGHSHLGWTMAMGSADIISDLILGETPSINPAPFSPER